MFDDVFFGVGRWRLFVDDVFLGVGGLGMTVFFFVNISEASKLSVSHQWPLLIVSESLLESHPYNSSYKVRVMSSPYVRDPIYLALVMVAKGHLNVVYLNQ